MALVNLGESLKLANQRYEVSRKLRAKYVVPEAALLGTALEAQVYLNQQQLEAQREGEHRQVIISMKYRAVPTNGTARQTRPVGTITPTESVTLTYKTVTETMAITKKMLDDNLLLIDEYYSNEVMQRCSFLRNEMSKDLLMTSQQLRATDFPFSNGKQLRLPFNKTTLCFESDATAATANLFFNQVSILMQQCLIPPTYKAIANASAMERMWFLSKQGTGNAQNLAWQFDSLFPTENIISEQMLGLYIDTPYDNTVPYVLAFGEGSFSVLPWVPKMNKKGWGEKDSYLGAFYTLKDPLYGDRLEYHVREVSDTIDSNTLVTLGDPQDIVTHIEIGCTYAIPVISAPQAQVLGVAQPSILGK